MKRVKTRMCGQPSGGGNALSVPRRGVDDGVVPFRWAGRHRRASGQVAVYVAPVAEAGLVRMMPGSVPGDREGHHRRRRRGRTEPSGGARAGKEQEEEKEDARGFTCKIHRGVNSERMKR